MRQIGYYLINSGFLIYGALRLLGAVPGVTHIMGWWENPIGEEIVAKLADGFPEMSEKAFVSLSMGGYMTWSALMGLFLTLGSLLALFKARVGYWLMGGYFALFAAMFVNYQAFNTKIVHFAVSLGLFVVMLLLSKRRSA